MIDINDYILLSKDERQKHLCLHDPCIERGGSSYLFKGLLAHILDTTIPTKLPKIQVCHACHNGACSNPNHLYWGTAAENCQDAINNGNKSAWQRTVDKYGIEEARIMMRRKSAYKGGKANAGKPKSEEHRKKISLTLMSKKDRSGDETVDMLD